MRKSDGVYADRSDGLYAWENPESHRWSIGVSADASDGVYAERGKVRMLLRPVPGVSSGGGILAAEEDLVEREQRRFQRQQG